MCAFVDFQIFRSRKYFATAWEGARERLLPCVHANVVHQFVFGLEWLASPRTVVPVAHVVTLLRAADVLHGDVRNQLVHVAEGLSTRFLAVCVLVWVDPFTDELLFNALTHITEECARMMMMMVVRCHIHAHVQSH